MRRIAIFVSLFGSLFACAHDGELPPPPDAGDTQEQASNFAAPPPGVDAAKRGADEYDAPPSTFSPSELRRDARSSHGASPGQAAPNLAATPHSQPEGRFEKAVPGRSSSRGAEGSRALADDSAGGGGGGAALSHPSPRPAPEERPGLGTSWGETRYSHVQQVPFARDSSRPSYSATLHYNDDRGARALTGGSYASSSASVSLGAALTISLRDEYRGLLSAYRGNGRTAAVGNHGQRYIIVLENHTNERFEVVLSVDGLDVIDGRDAGVGKRGYLLDPYAAMEIEGFRQSQDAVAAFRFGSVRDSYAARTGSARNVGVIGIAAFGERGYSARLRAWRDRAYYDGMHYGEVQRRVDADPFPNNYASPPLQWAR